MALTAEEFEGKTVRSLKTLVAKQIGVSIFRQRWLSEDHTELQDDDFVTSSDVQLVVLPFVQSEDEEVKELYSRLHLEISMNDSDGVENLLRKPLNPDSSQDPQTALHVAAECGHVECVALLLEAGADKDLADFEGTTALHLAADHGRSEVVKLLLEAGADKDAADYHDRTALHLAAWEGDLKVVKLLLDAGADKDATDDGGNTALDWATASGHLEIVRLLHTESIECPS